MVEVSEDGLTAKYSSRRRGMVSGDWGGRRVCLWRVPQVGNDRGRVLTRLGFA